MSQAPAERDLLAEAAAHFAKALTHWRDLRFILEIAEERHADFLGGALGSDDIQQRQ